MSDYFVRIGGSLDKITCAKGYFMQPARPHVELSQYEVNNMPTEALNVICEFDTQKKFVNFYQQATNEFVKCVKCMC